MTDLEDELNGSNASLISIAIEGSKDKNAMIKIPIKKDSNRYISFASQPIEGFQKGKAHIKDELKFEKSASEMVEKMNDEINVIIPGQNMKMGRIMGLRDANGLNKNIPPPEQRKKNAFDNLNLDDIMQIVEEN